jgi:hypothetical protein
VKPFDINLDEPLVALVYEIIGERLHVSDLHRSVHITPFDGAYGYAGVVLAINGSPSRAIIVFEGLTDREHDRCSRVVVMTPSKVRTYDVWRLLGKRNKRDEDILELIDYVRVSVRKDMQKVRAYLEARQS